jgi:hypothetical protein
MSDLRYDGLISLEVSPSMVLDERDSMALFDAIADHLRELGYEPEGFSVRLKLEFLGEVL